MNPKTGQPKRFFRNLKSITDFPEDVQSRLKDSGIPEEYFNQHLQDFVYCLRYKFRPRRRSNPLLFI